MFGSYTAATTIVDLRCCPFGALSWRRGCLKVNHFLRPTTCCFVDIHLELSELSCTQTNRHTYIHQYIQTDRKHYNAQRSGRKE